MTNLPKVFHLFHLNEVIPNLNHTVINKIHILVEKASKKKPFFVCLLIYAEINVLRV